MKNIDLYYIFTISFHISTFLSSTFSKSQTPKILKNDFFFNFRRKRQFFEILKMKYTKHKISWNVYFMIWRCFGMWITWGKFLQTIKNKFPFFSMIFKIHSKKTSKKSFFWNFLSDMESYYFCFLEVSTSSEPS